MWNLAVFLVVGAVFRVVIAAPRKLPHVPDVVFPPVPEVARLTEEQMKTLLETDQDPEVQPGLFQGDMALTNELYDFWRVGIRWDVLPERMWQNNTVPYVISPLYDTADYITIYNAVLTLKTMTCIKFIPWDGKAEDFLLIWPMKFPQGCWSYVGRFGGPQIVSLQPPDEKGPNCLGDEGRSVHEILHALGIFHEQSRADRDEFVDVHMENIIPEFYVNFNKESLENTTYSFEYDYNSVMHYGEYYFRKVLECCRSLALQVIQATSEFPANPKIKLNKIALSTNTHCKEKGQPTITAKKKGVKLGQRSAMSKTDCLKINDLYGCLDKSYYHRRKYYNICKFLGL